MKPKEKRGTECLGTPLCSLPYAPKSAHGKASTGCRSKLHMHIIMAKRLLRFMGRYSFLSNDMGKPVAASLGMSIALFGPSVNTFCINGRKIQNFIQTGGKISKGVANFLQIWYGNNTIITQKESPG